MGPKFRVATWPVPLAALALSACVTVGPDFQEPDVAWLLEWKSDLYGQVGQPDQAAGKDLYTAFAVRFTLFVVVTLYAWGAIATLEWLRSRLRGEAAGWLRAAGERLC